MPKDTDNIEPINASFEEVVGAIIKKPEKLEAINNRALPGFAMPDSVPIAIVKGVLKIGDLELNKSCFAVMAEDLKNYILQCP